MSLGTGASASATHFFKVGKLSAISHQPSAKEELPDVKHCDVVGNADQRSVITATA